METVRQAWSEIRAVYLFGSTSRGEVLVDSVLDAAVFHNAIKFGLDELLEFSRTILKLTEDS